MRENQIYSSIHKLVIDVNSTLFLETFGLPVNEVDTLIENKVENKT